MALMRSRICSREPVTFIIREPLPSNSTIHRSLRRKSRRAFAAETLGLAEVTIIFDLIASGPSGKSFSILLH
jgi:hypothetical protein